MKIALIGYGRMGRMVEEAALGRGYEIVARINRAEDLEGAADADVCIDFTHPDAVVNNMRTLSALGKNVVIGTTGWEQHFEEIQGFVKSSNVGAIYGSNFSIGVHLFFRMVRAAAQMVQRFEAYDVGVIESHHRKKVDSPSGTAKSVQNILLEACPEKQIQIASLRCGSIPGTHEVLFDSSVDTINICHTARSREGFAVGAVRAAEWLQGRRGFFSVDDMMKDLMQ